VSAGILPQRPNKNTTTPLSSITNGFVEVGFVVVVVNVVLISYSYHTLGVSPSIKPSSIIKLYHGAVDNRVQALAFSLRLRLLL